MAEGYKLNEFHCASNTSQPPVHISSHGDSAATVGSLYKKHSPEEGIEARRFAFIRNRSATMHCSSKSIVKPTKGITPNLDSKGKEPDKSVFLFHDTDKSLCPATVSIEEETKKLMNATYKALSAAPMLRETAADVTKSRSTTDSETGKGESQQVLVLAKDAFSLMPEQAPGDNSEAQLKQILTQSLSPSPFRNEDPGQREAKLDHLVSSAPGTAKGILFSTFYGSELAENDSHRAWKIALKDHIVNTFESICLIKKLKPVPSSIIEKKKLTVDNTKPSISTRL